MNETQKNISAASVREAPRATRPEGRRGRRGAGSRRPSRAERPRSEFDQKTLSIRRVARVVAGGRRFSFSAAVVIGNKKGAVGVGLGKGADTALALDKAARSGRKNLLRLILTKSGSLPHDVRAKYKSAIVEIIPSPGRGLVAGSAVRSVLELAGITDVVSKIHSRTKNKLNIARATVKALGEVKN